MRTLYGKPIEEMSRSELESEIVRLNGLAYTSKHNPINGDEMLEFLNKCNIFDLKTLRTMLIDQKKEDSDKIFNLTNSLNETAKRNVDLKKKLEGTCENCKHKKVCFINSKVNQISIVQGLKAEDFKCSLWSDR